MALCCRNIKTPCINPEHQRVPSVCAWGSPPPTTTTGLHRTPLRLGLTCVNNPRFIHHHKLFGSADVAPCDQAHLQALHIWNESGQTWLIHWCVSYNCVITVFVLKIWVICFCEMQNLRFIHVVNDKGWWWKWKGTKERDISFTQVTLRLWKPAAEWTQSSPWHFADALIFSENWLSGCCSFGPAALRDSFKAWNPSRC